jgi:uncharacterized protein (TIGR02118 family)
MPIAARMPRVQRFEASRVAATPDGGAPPYYRVAELWFDGQQEMQEAMSSPEGQATTADIGNFATGGVTLLIADVD